MKIERGVQFEGGTDITVRRNGDVVEVIVDAKGNTEVGRLYLTLQETRWLTKLLNGFLDE